MPLVISEINPVGGNFGAPFNQDYIELHNTSATAISLAGMSVQYGAATGTNWSTTALPSVMLAAGAYFLIAVGTVGGSGTAVPSPDHTTGAFNMSATAGKVALVNGTTALSGPGLPNATVLDFVGMVLRPILLKVLRRLLRPT